MHVCVLILRSPRYVQDCEPDGHACVTAHRALCDVEQCKPVERRRQIRGYSDRGKKVERVSLLSRDSGIVLSGTTTETNSRTQGCAALSARFVILVSPNIRCTASAQPIFDVALVLCASTAAASTTQDEMRHAPVMHA